MNEMNNNEEKNLEENQIGIVENGVFEITKIINEWREKEEEK